MEPFVTFFALYQITVQQLQNTDIVVGKVVISETMLASQV